MIAQGARGAGITHLPELRGKCRKPENRENGSSIGDEETDAEV
jgi:hypothetical protein